MTDFLTDYGVVIALVCAGAGVLYGALVTNCDVPRGKVSGLSTWSHARKTAHLEISAGLGTSIYAPVRFDCRPEAVVVTLTA